MAKGGKRVFVILLKRKQRFAVVGFPTSGAPLVLDKPSEARQTVRNSTYNSGYRWGQEDWDTWCTPAEQLKAVFRVNLV